MAHRPWHQQTADEGFVYGPADETYTVSDIPMLKERIANNPASAAILQALIDRLEAGDFDTPRTGPTETPTGDDTTPPGATNQEDINAAIAAAMEAAGIGPNFNFSDILTAADAEELFKNTLPIDYETLQKMGEADWMPENWTPTMQAMIDKSLGNIPDQNYIDQATLDAQLAGYPSAAEIQKLLEEQGWGAIGDPFGGALSGYSTTAAIQQMIKDNLALGLSADDIFTMIKDAFGETMSDDDIMAAIATAQEGQYTSLMDEVNALIADSLAQGMSEQEIMDLITAQYGDQMSDDDIMNAIAAAQEGVPTIQTIEAMINEALLEGMSPEDIAVMISDYVGDSGLLSADDIATMIADAIAGIETTPAEDALTADAVQQMIDTAMAQGMSTEQVQAMLAESGYMGEEGIQGLIGSTLEGALGQGGSISQAIQAALAATGDAGTGVPEMDFTQPYTPGSFPTSPYGEVDPYSLMGTNQFAGTTPFSGGTTTGAASSTGLGTLNLGDPAQYNFDIPTTLGVDLYPSGIDPKYFEPPPEEPEGPYDPRKDPRFWID